MKILSTLALLLFVTACKSAPKVEPAAAAPAALPTSIEEAVASPTRNSENRKRDIYRHPIETLNFFGFQPNMTVVEISPGGGWYMEILAPLLHANGQYIAALPPATGEMANLNNQLGQWIKGRPEMASKIKTVTMAPPADLVPDGSADMVLTFRNVHNWMMAGTEQAQFNSFFRALKPGGVLGVVEHRANAKSKHDPKGKSGYVREADVIRFATKAGFKLAAKSEINANPKDTKDYPAGVWTLPPTLRLKDQDREKYLAIGESDRMTLRFVKPMRNKPSEMWGKKTR